MHYNKDFKTPSEWLDILGFDYLKKGKELLLKCPYGCDTEGKSRHFYMSSDTGCYYCHKCGHKGNLLTFFADTGKSQEVFQDYIKQGVHVYESCHRIIQMKQRRSAYDKR